MIGLQTSTYNIVMGFIVAVVSWGKILCCIDAFDNWNGCILLPKPIDAKLITDASQIFTLRCHSKWQRRSRIFWQCSWKQTQIIGRCGCSYSIGSIHCPCNWKNYSSGVRQHFNHGLLEPYGRTKPRIESDSKCSTGRGYKQSRINYLLSHTRKKTASDRLSRLNDRYEWQLHPELFNFLDIMRGPHTIDRFASGTTVYYSILSAKILRCKRSGPARLDTAQQFRKCTISSYARNTTSA